MNLSNLLILLLVGKSCCAKFNILKNLEEASSHQALADAVNTVVNQIKTTSNVFFPADNHRLKNFMNLILSTRRQPSEAVFKLDTSQTRKIFDKKSFFLFLVENSRQIEFIFENRESYGSNSYFLMLSLDDDSKDRQETFRKFNKLKLYNVNFMYQSKNDSVVIETFMPFNSRACNDATSVKINEFKSGKLESDEIFPKKLKNLHKCPVRVAISNDIPPFIVPRKNNNGTLYFHGQDITRLKALEHNINFTLNYTYIGSEGIFFENGTCNGTLGALLNDTADVSIGNLHLKPVRLKYLDATYPYTTEPLAFVIPPGEPWTPLEKLIFPFSRLVWICIFATYAVSLIVIQVTKNQKPTVQNIIFGEGVRHPHLNLLAGFLGGIQKILPKQNFPRFLLMNFLIFSLIIRSSYQGLYFKFAQSNYRKHEVQSIQEMIGRNFKFYVYSATTDVFRVTPAVRER